MIARNTIIKREDFLPIFEPGTMNKLKHINSFTRESVDSMNKGNERNQSSDFWQIDEVTPKEGNPFLLKFRKRNPEYAHG